MSKTSKKTGQKYSRFFSLTTYATESVKATAFTTPNKPQKSPTSNARKDFLFLSLKGRARGEIHLLRNGAEYEIARGLNHMPNYTKDNFCIIKGRILARKL
ncbi:MAG: hypothetical protein IJX28_09100 [Clostridia bacterium]|nr:hypothetical protein [Clostridia bacterium]